MRLEKRIGIDGKEHVYTMLSEEQRAAKKAEMLKCREEMDKQRKDNGR